MPNIRAARLLVTSAVVFASLAAFGHDLRSHSTTRVVDGLELRPTAPAEASTVERLSGELRRVTIEDRVAGAVTEHYALKLDDGSAIALKNVQGGDLASGDRVEAIGRRNGQLLFSTGVRVLRKAAGRDLVDQKSKPELATAGTLALLHADDFDAGRSDFVFEVHEKSGGIRRLDLGVPAEALQPA